jgi:hypothetical protein
LDIPSRRNGVGQQVQSRYGRAPVDAAIRNTLAIGQSGARQDILATGDQIALDHRADDALLALGYLTSDRRREGGRPFP